MLGSVGPQGVRHDLATGRQQQKRRERMAPTRHGRIGTLGAERRHQDNVVFSK